MEMRKLISGFTAFCMATVMLAGYSVSAADMGDITENGESNSEDALAILNYVVGNADLTDEQKANSDIDGNGNIDSADALGILQYTVGLKSSLYEKFIGEYNGFFGDEKTTSYKSDNLTINSLSISIDSIDGKNVSGLIYMSNNMLSNASYAFTSEIKDNVMYINIVGATNPVKLEINFYFKGNEITGEITNAVIAGKSYSFPTIYFEKK